MDYWASLEHDLTYKLTDHKTDEMVRELKDCADVIAQTDIRMQKLKNMICTG
jgi:putative GTP pyrophosphokinase